ncbi:hypothetical protein CPB97_008038 [Podila verticillata]|nr:hypothetical protein CPB97_008038 [Podila verticillata]
MLQPNDNDVPHAIFKIPEIIALIALHMSPADLASAARVSRRWHSPCASQLWRQILEDQSMWTSLTDALPQYSNFVRELSCSRYFDLARIGTSCSHLVLFRPPIIDVNNIDLFIKILERNKNIKTLALSFQHPERILEAVTTVLQLVKALNLISLEVDNVVVDRGTLEHILDSSHTLEYLEISRWCEVQAPSAAISMANSLNPYCPVLETLAVSSVHDPFTLVLTVAKSAPNLKALSFSDMDEPFQTLVQSPVLVDFSSKLKASCPHLHELTLCRNAHDIDGLNILLDAFPGLRSIHAEEYSDTACVLQALAQHPLGHPFLETIVLSSQSALTHTWASTALNRILLEKGALKDIRLKNYLIDKLILDLHTGWACVDLERFEISFAKFFNPSISATEQQHIEELFHMQLNRLLKLNYT